MIKLQEVRFEGTSHVYKAVVDGVELEIVDTDGDGRIDGMRAHDVHMTPDEVSRKFGEAAQERVCRFRESLLLRELPRVNRATRNRKAQRAYSGLCSDASRGFGPSPATSRIRGSASVTDLDGDGKVDVVKFRATDGTSVEISSALLVNRVTSSCLALEPSRAGVEQYLSIFDPEQ